jgi:hypothetical protein
LDEGIPAVLDIVINWGQRRKHEIILSSPVVKSCSTILPFDIWESQPCTLFFTIPAKGWQDLFNMMVKLPSSIDHIPGLPRWKREALTIKRPLGRGIIPWKWDLTKNRIGYTIIQRYNYTIVQRYNNGMEAGCR